MNYLFMSQLLFLLPQAQARKYIMKAVQDFENRDYFSYFFLAYSMSVGIS